MLFSVHKRPFILIDTSVDVYQEGSLCRHQPI